MLPFSPTLRSVLLYTSNFHCVELAAFHIEKRTLPQEPKINGKWKKNYANKNLDKTLK